MTKLTIALSKLLEKGADADLLRQMIQFVAQRTMELDVEGLMRSSMSKDHPFAFDLTSHLRSF
jgi:putative transposase